MTTDVLAEGINLHRANVIVNYDTPWNPTKLIQRLGRINRIGTKAQTIYNYNFYPSQHGDAIINLRERSEAKLQSSHSAYGEDNKIYSLREIIDQFRMFEEKDEERDIRTEYLEFLRNFKEQNKEHFDAIKKMPLKVRCIRHTIDQQHSIAFVKNGDYKNIYLYSQGQSFALPFEKAVKIFEAKKSEVGILPIPEIHYQQINQIINQFEKDITTPEMVGGVQDKLDVRSQTALNDLSGWIGIIDNPSAKEAAIELFPLVKNGTYSNLINEIYKIRKSELQKLEIELIRLAKKYTSKLKRSISKDVKPIAPQIIISETFV